MSDFNCMFNIHLAVDQFQVPSSRNHISIPEHFDRDNVRYCTWDLLESFRETFENRMERSLSILGGFWRLSVVNTRRTVVCVQKRRHINVHNGIAVSMGSNRRSCNYFVEERASERASEREREREREREGKGEKQKGKEERRNGLDGVLFYRRVMEISTDVMPPLRLSLRHCNISPFSSLLPSMIFSSPPAEPGKRSLRAWLPNTLEIHYFISVFL